MVTSGKGRGDSTDYSKPARKKSRSLFYGWYIVLASFLAGLSYSQQNSSTLGIFIRPMTDELGWSRTAITGAQSAARFVEGAVAPLIGPLIDRYGPRPLMIVGGIVVGFGSVLISNVQDLTQWYLLRSLVISIGFALMGWTVTTIALSNWFVRKRGRAIAIGSMGNHVTSSVMPPLAVAAMANWGWRPIWSAFGILTWIVVVIPAAIWMRRRPEDLGLRPDGDSAVPLENLGEKEGAQPGWSSTADEPLEPVWSRGEALRTKAFWLIVTTFAVSNLALQGINISLVPLIEDEGFSAGTAAIALSVRFISLVALTPVAGLLAERVEPKYVNSIGFLLQGVAAALFMLGGSLLTLYAAILVYALGQSISSVTSEMIWADVYGRLTLGAVRSIGAPPLTIVSATGPVFMNAVYDVTGSYRLAFMSFIVLFTFSAVAILFLNAPKAKRFARASEFGQTGSATA